MTTVGVASRLAPFVPAVLQGPRGAAGAGHWTTEGTLVFADVSGFTRLTERLSAEGKAGAEEIVTTISRVFDAMLSACDDHGDVLKFSGDALLLFFDGPDHAARACSAALAMRGALADVGRVESSRGPVRLRMSVGVHAGAFDFLLCGTDHLELLVTGPAASRTVALEAAAAPGQVLASHATARALPHGSRTRVTPHGVLVHRVGPVPVGAVPGHGRDDVCDIDLHRFVPALLRGRLGTPGDGHEHRRATVAFVRAGGLEAVRREAGVGDVWRRVQTLVAEVMAATSDHGVLLTATDLTADGVVIMLTAGAPETTGDDELRMLRVATRLVSETSGLRVRVGLNTGRVFVGDVGPHYRRTWSTMGDATNLAARVSTIAAWGTVLATTGALDAVAGRAQVRPVAPFRVKGKRAPVTAAEVVAATAPPQATDDGVPLVGRDEEVARLRRSLATAHAGPGRALQVVGEAGSGKSRLLHTVLSTVEAPRLELACEPWDSSVPHHGACRLLRGALDLADDTAPSVAGRRLTEVVTELVPELVPWLRLLAVLVDAEVADTPTVTDIAPRFVRDRTHQAAVELLAALLPGPATIVVGDAEHLDDDSAALLRLLVRTVLPRRPWALVLSRADRAGGLDLVDEDRADVLRLGPLAPGDATALARVLADQHPVPAQQLATLVEHAGGNPLFLIELVRAAATSGVAELPRSVEAVLAARIDALAPGDRTVLRDLSVLGRRFGGDLLAAVLGPRAGDVLDSGRLGAFVVRRGGQVRFRDELTRQVAYEGLPYRRRRELHAGVADVLEARGDHAQLPLHLASAERWAAAWTSAVEAADAAAALGATATAGDLYELGLRVARRLRPPPPELAAVAERGGDALVLAGLPERAGRTYAAAVTASRDPVARVRRDVKRGGTDVDRGLVTTGLRRLGRALTTARTIDVLHDRLRAVARVELAYAQARLRQGRPEDAVTHGLLAVAAAEEVEGDEELAAACHVLDAAHVALGDLATASAWRDRALPVFLRLGDLAAQGTVLHDLAADAFAAGRIDEAEWLYARSHETRRRAGDVIGEATSIHGLARVHVARGEQEEAERRLHEARRTFRGAGHQVGRALATGDLGALVLASGRTDEALTLLAHAHDDLVAVGAQSHLASVRLRLAGALLAAERWVEAWEAATLVVDDGDAAAGPVADARRMRAVALRATGGDGRAAAEDAAAAARQ